MDDASRAHARNESVDLDTTISGGCQTQCAGVPKLCNDGLIGEKRRKQTWKTLQNAIQVELSLQILSSDVHSMSAAIVPSAAWCLV